jgi:5'/3'-nucleotidase SurE
MVSANGTEGAGARETVNVLVVNDDGVTAPGLHALVVHLAATARCHVYVVAPDSERSGWGYRTLFCSHTCASLHCIRTR